jgi:hypothetical protein
VAAVLGRLEGAPALMAALLYGAGGSATDGWRVGVGRCKRTAVRTGEVRWVGVRDARPIWAMVSEWILSRGEHLDFAPRRSRRSVGKAQWLAPGTDGLHHCCGSGWASRDNRSDARQARRGDVDRSPDGPDVGEVERSRHLVGAAHA